jgi:hypothetical protein
VAWYSIQSPSFTPTETAANEVTEDKIQKTKTELIKAFNKLFFMIANNKISL